MNEKSKGPVVSLREVTKETVRAVCDLHVADAQKGFVAENAMSIAQAYFEPRAWFRAIYADDTPVGFIMLFDDPEKPEYFLWRYMIGADFQGKGFGKQALALVVDHVKSRPGAAELFTSYVPGEGSPHGFYQKVGFKDTGKSYGIEKEMKLELKQ